MEKPTKEQIETFWEKCGLIEQPTGSWYEDKVGDKFISNTMPTMALNHIFKYAIPKLQSEVYQIDITCYEHKGFEVCLIEVLNGEAIKAKCEDDDLSLAIFGAIWEIIK